jgi:hypothetical protein
MPRTTLRWIAALTALMAPPALAADGERITAVVGSAHHTCALWCSAGGIPVGLLAEDGQVYMVLKVEGSAATNGGDTLLTLASDTITADGMVYRRDGLNYIVVEKVVSNQGIARLNHEDYGAIPDFAVPEPKQ